MIGALLLAVAGPAMTAVEAERAFAAEAQKSGQWTAFRKYAAENAIMFVPQPVNAQDFLKGRADPPRSVQWQPDASFVSCDGEMAVNHGPVQRADGSNGHFTTVWVKQAGVAGPEWRWVYDAGQNLISPFGSAVEPNVRKADCAPVPANRRLNRVSSDQGQSGHGESPDGTIAWYWAFTPQKIRWFHVELWNGRTFETVIDQQVDQKFQGLPRRERPK